MIDDETKRKIREKMFANIVDTAQDPHKDGATWNVNVQTFLLAEIAQDLKRSVAVQEAMLIELQTLRHRS